MHEVVFYAKGVVRDLDCYKAWIELYHEDEKYNITMHEHYLSEKDLFQKGRWFDFRVVRVDGEIELELGRRPDLELPGQIY